MFSCEVTERKKMKWKKFCHSHWLCMCHNISLSSWLSVFGRAVDYCIIKNAEKSTEVFLLLARLEHCWFFQMKIRFSSSFPALLSKHKCNTRRCRRRLMCCIRRTYRRGRERGKSIVYCILWTHCDPPFMSWCTITQDAFMNLALKTERRKVAHNKKN